jgi:ABC-2 type transport system ATP-binding protein
VSAPVLVLDRLVCRYGATTAVDGLSLELRSGEMFGLIGPDGAGKTTAIRAVLGLLAPASGRVRTLGLDPRAQRAALSRRVGYLSQGFSLYGDLSVDENLAFFAAVHDVGGWRARRDELLELVRMTPFRDRRADRLSGGMKQKLALACTLIHTPELLVLDEPTTGVDPVSRRDFWALLAGLQRRGLTILLTTPYLDEAERCQHVALVHEGRLLELDAPDALREQADEATLEVVARPPRRALERLRERDDVGEIEVYGERLHVRMPRERRSGAEAAAGRLRAALVEAGLEVEQVRAIIPSLEDVFIARIRDAASAVPGGAS